jgi:signal transduction histidine kinase/ActR/RegA family two-component response regulator
LDSLNVSHKERVAASFYKWLSDEKSLLALDALAKLNIQFANKPEFGLLIKTFLLTLAGQFSITSAFALLRKPEFSRNKTVYLATGHFSKDRQLASLPLTSDMERLLVSNEKAARLSEIKYPDICKSYFGILRERGVEVICPLVYQDKLLGIIGLGKKVARKDLDDKDMELFNSLMHSVVPLIASSYHFWEMASLSGWYLDILNHVKQGVFAFAHDNHLKKINEAGFDIIRRHNPDISAMPATYTMVLEDIFDERCFDDWGKRFIKGITENDSGSIEGLILKTGDTEYAYDVYYCKISGDSEFQADFIITLDDVTERRQAEQQQRQLQEKLERAEKMEALGLLAGGVAHDLNNMLGPLVGYPELILMKLPEDSPIRNQVNRIADSARNASNVIQDLLTLARRGRYEMEAVNLNKIIAEYIESPSHIKKCQDRSDVECKFVPDKNISNIQGSFPHLYKVVMNLIVNAFDAMPKGGQLTVSTSQAHLERLPASYKKIEEGDYVILRVRDTGMGIEKQDIERIFEPYFSTKKMGSSGSGLGLSVVYGIIRDHKGHCDIFSEVGKGTEFMLYFRATKQLEKSVDNEEALGGDEKVLVVDDIREQREIAGDLLSSVGYKVATAENGHQALEYLEHHQVDMVLLDMIMEPDFDGLDTYREILKLNPQQKTIVVSGFSETERVKEIEKLGECPYIKKPFTLNTIAKAIRSELDEKVDGR